MRFRPALFLLVALAGCSSAADDPSLDLLGGSVDGLRLGDPESAVVTALGTPTSQEGADGFVTSTYGVGEQERILVTTYDGLVQSLFVRPAYEGQTSGGVGIGSRRPDVEQELGPPSGCTTFGTFTCFHDLPSHSLNVAYEQGGTVKAIVMLRQR